MAARASVRIPLALAVAFALAGCSSFDLARVLKKPEVTVKGAEIELLTFEEARIRFDVALANPNPVGVRLAGFDYRLNLDGAEFLNGTVDREVSIAAHASSTVPVPVAFRHEADAIGPRSVGRLYLPITLNLLSAGRTAAEALGKRGPVSYVLDGRAAVTTPLPLLKSAVVPFHLEGQTEIAR